jgi:hypothetical protein
VKSTPIDHFRLGHDDGHGSMYFEVRIFEDELAMRAHYRRSRVLSMDLKGDAWDAWLADAAAICAARTLGPKIGLILLPREALTTRVVSHELVHAALTYYRERRRRGGQPATANFGDGCTWREEAFAHIYCRLMGRMSTLLHDRGYWPS